jgi:hypothetical protein
LGIDEDRNVEPELLYAGGNLADLFRRMRSRIAFAGSQPGHRNQFDLPVSSMRQTARLAHGLWQGVVLSIDALKRLANAPDLAPVVLSFPVSITA